MRRTKKFKLNIEFVRVRKIIESLVQFHAQKDGIEIISSRLSITPRFKETIFNDGTVSIFTSRSGPLRNCFQKKTMQVSLYLELFSFKKP